MARRGVDRLGVPRGRAVAAAVVWRTEMRAALQHLARDPDLGLARVITLRLVPAARVQRDAAGFRGIGLMPGGPPITRPLPDVPDHVVEAVAVRRKRPHRRGALIAVGREV